MHVYFVGIGGAGLGPLAELAQDAGLAVSGSDLQVSPISRELESRGVDVVYEQTAASIASEHLTNPIDWLVYTSALADDHPELTFARQHGIRVSKRDEFLQEFLAERGLQMIAVAGTHGKTTTTGMLIWTFLQLKIPVSYLIGTTISYGPSGRFDPDSKYFIYEADEYDRNFLAFHPTVAVLPSVDYDHADIYPTVDDYKAAFRQFIGQSAETIMFERTENYLEPLDANYTSYEHSTTADEIALPGQMRRDDAYLAAKVVQTIGDYDDQQLYDILAKFPGTSRRFERLAANIYTDYAHHPKEIHATLQMALEVNPDVVVVYQPHQNMRQLELAADYHDAFVGARHVYWLPTYLPPGDREKSSRILTPADLIARLDNAAVAEPAEMNDDLWLALQTHLAANCLVLALSAGDLDAWLRTAVAKL
jgi:UDP-N-acetylmuramate--alanine ligase